MKVEIGPYLDNEDERIVDIKIDSYDTWNLDHTLALIIVPALKAMKEQKQGVSFVYDEDVPEELRNENQYSEEKWQYVLGEMIKSFESVLNFDEHTLENSRFKKGFALFGKYYNSLWT